MTEPSSKSEVRVCKCGAGINNHIHQGLVSINDTDKPHPFEPQPPVSAPECEMKGLEVPKMTDSAQPTPSEGPYHPAMDRLSVKFGPDEFQVKFSSPETVGTECILMNMGFAKAQASSAKEIECLRGALEAIRQADKFGEIADHVVYQHKRMTASEVCDIALGG